MSMVMMFTKLCLGNCSFFSETTCHEVLKIFSVIKLMNYDLSQQQWFAFEAVNLFEIVNVS